VLRRNNLLSCAAAGGSNLSARGACFGLAHGDNVVADNYGRFVWYELMTTDVEGARAFYAEVLGWDTRDASTADLGYTLFISKNVEIGGLMPLPPEAIAKGATQRWLGYVGVDNVDKIASQIARSGGTIYVPPTDTNIGRIAVVADLEMATFGLVGKVPFGQHDGSALEQTGRVGWHELFAIEPNKAFAFYQALFGWQNADSEIGAEHSYRLFLAGSEAIGGMFAKSGAEASSFWLYYFNVDDIDAAMQRVNAAGGRIFDGPIEVPGENWVVRCADPQGAPFALQGGRSKLRGRPGSQLTWSASWGGLASKGRVIVEDRKSPKTK
jgi:uncharacterized protein